MSELIRRDAASAPAVYQSRPPGIWIDAYLDEKQSDLARYGEIILKRKWLALSVALIVFGAVCVWVFTSKRLYTSTVKLQIDPQESVLPYKDMYAVSGDPRYLGTQAQVLKSEALASRIVTRLNLAHDPAQLAPLARSFSGNLIVTTVEGTQVLTVSYRSEDPAFAATAINTLADEYVNYGFETKRETITKARDFLDEELAKQKQKLEQSEQHLVNYGRAHQSLLPTENNSVTKKLADLNQEMTKVETEVLSNQYQSLLDTPVDSFPEKLKTNVMRGLESRRSELEQKLATATLKFGPKWPEVLSLNEELADARQQLARERRKILEQEKAEYGLATAHRQRVAGALAAQTTLADQLAQDSIQFNILRRGAETDRQLYESLLQRLKEMDVSAGLKSGNVHVIDRGFVPKLPSSPNIPLSLALGLMFSLVSGVTCALGVAYFDQTVKTPEDVEYELRMSFLGAIPAFDKAWKAVSGGHLMPLDWHPGRAFAPLTQNAAVYWESYRELRTALLFSPETRPNTILVTSTLPGEGKSTTAINLAITLAQTGARTIILELDMRRPKLAHTFDFADGRGMSRYLSGQSELHTEIYQTGIPNLFLVPSGPIPPNPPELIGSPRMKRGLEVLRPHFEYVIIDGPPLLPVTDAAVIATQVNGVVMVVGGKTSKTAVHKARNLLKSVNANLLGAVINNVKMDVSKHDYYSGMYSNNLPEATVVEGSQALERNQVGLK